MFWLEQKYDWCFVLSLDSKSKTLLSFIRIIFQCHYMDMYIMDRFLNYFYGVFILFYRWPIWNHCTNIRTYIRPSTLRHFFKKILIWWFNVFKLKEVFSKLKFQVLLKKQYFLNCVLKILKQRNYFDLNASIT